MKPNEKYDLREQKHITPYRTIVIVITLAQYKQQNR